jgi:hypothetical protein
VRAVAAISPICCKVVLYFPVLAHLKADSVAAVGLLLVFENLHAQVLLKHSVLLHHVT